MLGITLLDHIIIGITVIPVCWNRESDPEKSEAEMPKGREQVKEHDADSKCIRHRPWHQYRQNL